MCLFHWLNIDFIWVLNLSSNQIIKQYSFWYLQIRNVLDFTNTNRLGRSIHNTMCPIFPYFQVVNNNFNTEIFIRNFRWKFRNFSVHNSNKNLSVYSTYSTLFQCNKFTVLKIINIITFTLLVCRLTIESTPSIHSIFEYFECK